MSMQTSLLKLEYIPLNKIKRPIPPVLDENKINLMVSTLNGKPTASSTCEVVDMVAGELPPIDVFKVKEKGQFYYFAFGGCHRFQAYEKMGSDTLVKCRLLPATRDTLKVYLGSSVDTMFDN